MDKVTTLLQFVHNDSIMSNLAASAITAVLALLIGTTWVRKLRDELRDHMTLIEESHRLLHHVHRDAAVELGHDVRIP
jgi:hypothetical protein